MFGFLYLQQILHTASNGTDIQALEKRINELKNEERALKLEGARLRSIQTVEERVKELNLVPTDHVTYLKTAPNRLAAKTR
jgi:hypothetical protein